MHAISFLQAVDHLRTPVFTLPDVARIIGKSKAYARLYVHRLKQKHYIYEVERGKYSLLNDALEVASAIVFPSYVSFLSAYSLYGLTTQIPVIVQVAVVRSRKLLMVGRTKIEFVTLHPRCFFGYRKQIFRSKIFFIADKEKAIIDSLYLPEHCPLSETFEALQDKELDKEKLVEYALRMGSIVTVKRLGYMLELQGLDIYGQVKHILNRRYDRLSPFSAHSSKNSKKWRLNINEEFP